MVLDFSPSKLKVANHAQFTETVVPINIYPLRHGFFILHCLSCSFLSLAIICVNYMQNLKRKC